MMPFSVFFPRRACSAPASFNTTPVDGRSRLKTTDVAKHMEPCWAVPEDGKWVNGFVQDGLHMYVVKVRWVRDLQEYQNIDRQREHVIGWTDPSTS